MYDQLTETPPSILIIFLLSISILADPSLSATDSFIFSCCSQLNYSSDSTYSSYLNLLLSSLVSSAASLSYNNLTVVGLTSQTTISGLFQCRGDLDSTSCGQCVTDAVSRLGTACPNSCGGALKLDGCFVKYDNVSFVGVEDNSEVVKYCGSSISSDANMMSRYEAVMDGLGLWGGTYRISGSGDSRGVAQCVGDLSASQCQDCITTAIGRLRNECGPSSSGDMFLAKCYARYSMGASDSPNGKKGEKKKKGVGDHIGRTLAITIVAVIGNALLISVIYSYLRRPGKEEVPSHTPSIFVQPPTLRVFRIFYVFVINIVGGK